MKRVLFVILCLAVCFTFTTVLQAVSQSQSNGVAPQAPQGEGRWIYTAGKRAGKEVLNSANPGGISGKYEWSVPGTKSPAAAPSILIYVDDVGTPPPTSKLDLALQSAGLAYTAHYNGDFSGFISSLNSGTWSLVIFDHENQFLSSDSVYTAMDNYVRNGGRLIFLSWNVGLFPTHPLIADLGVQYVSDTALGPPPVVHWWYPQHRIVNGVPEYISLNDFYGIDGQFTTPLAGTSVLGGYTVAPTGGQGTIFTANNNRTVYIGFLEGNNLANLDGDAQLDGVELWYNLISFTLGSPLVMIYTDNSITAAPPNTFPELALRQLGFVYTPAYNNPDTSIASLLALKNWDLVIIAADGTTFLNPIRASLNTYVLNGGKLIYHDWGAFTFSPADPLYATMGVSLVNSDFTPEQVHWWNATHPYFSGVPELLSPINSCGCTFGQLANPAGSGTAIAGFTAAPSANNAGLIVANNNRTIYKSFIDFGQNGSIDADADSVADIVELWANMIRLVGGQTILAFDDDYVNNPRFMERGLNKFGYAYVFTSSQATLESLVPTRGWDMALVAAENFVTSTTTKDELLAYVNSGGKLIYEDWSASAGHPLNAALGSIFINNSTTIPPIFWWRDTHPLFTIPNIVPEFTVLTDNYGFDSINVQPIGADFTALGGATPTTSQNVANVVLGNNFRTIFKGFLDGNNMADLDGNTVLDGEDLWTNLVSFMVKPGLFADDFDNSHLDSSWTVVKTAWSEGNGAMIGNPVKKAIVYANGFDGCEVCSIQTQFKVSGGVGNKLWILGWYKDKSNTLEVLINEEKNKILLKQRIGGAVLLKNKILTPIDPNTTYDMKITHNGTSFTVFINGTSMGTFAEVPSSTWFGTVGYQVKLTTATIDDVFILP